jgi:hypothetical protein
MIKDLTILDLEELLEEESEDFIDLIGGAHNSMGPGSCKASGH